MKRFKPFLNLLGSGTLTVWLSGVFIVYYLTVAVWSKEAFAHFIALLSGNTFCRALYLLFFANVLVRMLNNLKRVWPAKLTFFFRLPLYAGMLVLLLAFFFSLNTRKNTWLLIGEGDVIRVPWERSLLRVSGIRPALRRNELKMNDSVIFSSEPAITLLDENGVSHTVGAFPPRLVGSNYMHVLNFGIGPGVELREKNNAIIRTYVALRLTPFGSVDKFKLPPAPYTFYLNILPNRVIKKGGETAKQYDLEKPVYGVEVVKGDRKIMKAETDDTVTFDHTMSLRFHRPSDWVLLDVAYDPFLPLFVAGLVMTGAGIIVYPLSLIAYGRTAARKAA